MMGMLGVAVVVVTVMVVVVVLVVAVMMTLIVSRTAGAVLAAARTFSYENRCGGMSYHMSYHVIPCLPMSFHVLPRDLPCPCPCQCPCPCLVMPCHVFPCHVLHNSTHSTTGDNRAPGTPYAGGDQGDSKVWH